MVMRVKHLDSGKAKMFPVDETIVTYRTKCAHCGRRIEVSEEQYHEFGLKYGYGHDLWFCDGDCVEKARVEYVEYATDEGRRREKPVFREAGRFPVLVN